MARTDDASRPARAGFFRRRIVGPILAALRQGATPGQLAGAVALGTVCGVFPFLGATTVLSFALALAFGLNQPVVQAVNYLLSPLQLVAIPVFVHAGAWILGGDAQPFAIDSMISTFRSGSFGRFLEEFGQAGAFAFVAWVIAAPVLFVAVFAAFRPVLLRLAARANGGAS